MKNCLIAGLILSAFATIETSGAEPAIMTVNGEEIPSSEFKYLFKKNSDQQLEPLTLDEYLSMFEIYRLKVADAKAEGKDTTADFRREVAQYKRELSRPYMVDSTYLNHLVDLAAERDKEEVEVTHIMLMKTRDMGANLRSQEILDSLRKEIHSANDMQILAREFSQDKTVSNNSGYLGYVSAGRFPFSFECAAYETPQGTVSEVFETPVGYHILMPGNKRPSRGKVNASHIMKLIPQKSTPEFALRQKQQIDSIYQIVKNDPSQFNRLAKELSEDKGSARQEGQLPEFGAGEMVAEFEEVAFELQPGEISEPVRSQYGWHVIRKNSHRPSREFDEIKNDVIKRASNPQDGRFDAMRKKLRENLISKHGGYVNQAIIDNMKDMSAGRLDSILYANWTTMPVSKEKVASVKGHDVTVADIARRLSKIRETRPQVSYKYIDNAVEAEYEKALMEAEEAWLFQNNEDYRNLINEYTDGSMLYEVSVEKVWDRASNDEDGLMQFYTSHKDNYKFDQPHAKGLLVQAANDSIALEIKREISELSTDSIFKLIKSNYPGKASVEKFVLPRGVNPMVDYLVFGGKAVVPKNKNFETFFVVDSKIIEAPEEMVDVRGSVTADYQTELENEWVAEIRKKYPVVINRKEVEKLKKEFNDGK